MIVTFWLLSILFGATAGIAFDANLRPLSDRVVFAAIALMLAGVAWVWFAVGRGISRRA